MAHDCLFCRMINGEIATDVVFEDDDVFAFNDINPQAPHHVLIVPKKHISTLNDLSENDHSLVGKVTFAAAKIAADIGIAEPGYRTVFNCNADAGQAVFHIHLHLLGGRRMTWPPG